MLTDLAFELIKRFKSSAVEPVIRLESYPKEIAVRLYSLWML